MPERDPWEVLGVPRGASADEVKAAWKRLQFTLHPDRNRGKEAAAEERFKEGAAAFARVRRATAATPSTPPEDPNLDDDLDDEPGAEETHTAAVPFWAAVEGRAVELVTPRGRAVTLRVPVGARSGDRLRLRRMGGPGVPPGDLIVTLAVAPDKLYTRGEGDTLCRTLEVTWLEAWRGDFLEIETPWGTVGLELRAGTHHGQVYEVLGHGVRRASGAGSLLLRVALRAPPPPERLTGDVALALAEALRAAYDAAT